MEPLLTFALEFAHTEGQHDTTLTITPVAVDYILDSNCKTTYSTRPIRRFIKCSIVTELSKLITQGRLIDDAIVTISYDSNRDVFRTAL